MVVTKLTESDSELQGILDLQRVNLRRNLSPAEIEESGFLTAEYSLDYLRRMHRSAPSVIALDGDEVVGYVLATTSDVREGHPLVADLFTKIDALSFAGRPLGEQRYLVVGQACIGRGHRATGLFRRLYTHFREAMQGRFRCAVTDVAQANPRSLRAHHRVGFQTIHSMEYEGLAWDIILWDWSKTAPSG